MITNALHQRQRVLKAALSPVIEKQSPDAAGFLAMGQVKIVITPSLHFRIQILAKRLAGRTCGLMPMHNIFSKGIKRGEVEAAPKIPILIIDKKEPEIGVKGRHKWVSRMHDHGDGSRLKAFPRQMRIALAGRRGQGLTDAVSKLHRAALDMVATIQHPWPCVTAAGGLNFFQAKGLFAVNGLDGLTDLTLQSFKVINNVTNIRKIAHRQPFIE